MQIQLLRQRPVRRKLHVKNTLENTKRWQKAYRVIPKRERRELFWSYLDGSRRKSVSFPRTLRLAVSGLESEFTIIPPVAKHNITYKVYSITDFIGIEETKLKNDKQNLFVRLLFYFISFEKLYKYHGVNKKYLPFRFCCWRFLKFSAFCPYLSEDCSSSKFRESEYDMSPFEGYILYIYNCNYMLNK